MRKRILLSFICFLTGCSIFLTSGCFLLKSPSKNAATTGKWDGDTFANTWSNLMVELPETFTREKTSSFPGHTEEFFIIHEDGQSNISLMYVDLAYGRQQNSTAEDYLNTVQEQLSHSENKDYIFADDFENVVIAGEEFLMLHAEFSFKNFSLGEKAYQDGYARKFDNYIILFLVCYTDETKETVDLFMSSITKAE